jgi:acyl dehydratase
MTERYFEDFRVGDRFESAGMTITEAAIVDFAIKWDPQPFHMDAEAARHWNYGGLIASGMHTMSAALRLWLDQGVFRACNIGSPGLDAVRFPQPVKPGDTLRVTTEIVDIRASASKPDRGVVRIRQSTRNQRGEEVLTMETVVFLKRRPA